MVLDDSALLEMIEMLRTADGGELMRRLLGGMLQAVVDAEATAAHIGAGLHERSDARTTQRNGTRDKLVTTAAGDLTVKIPKVRTGSFFPALLAPRRRIDVALHAVVMQAYVEGVSTRRVDDLVIAMGGTGISKSEVSRICAQLDSEVAIWRTRTLEHIAFPYVFLDATYCKVRLAGRVVRGLPARPLAQDLEHQPPRAPQPRGQKKDRRRGDLPQPGSSAAAVQLCAHRGPRRVARQRPPLPVRGVHGAAEPADTDRPGTQDRHPGQVVPKEDRRYGIVAPTRTATRDELHHSLGCDPPARVSGSAAASVAGRWD